jgi:hypothetical protein
MRSNKATTIVCEASSLQLITCIRISQHKSQAFVFDMDLIEQAYKQKHVWKTLDLVRDIVTRVETSHIEQQNIWHGSPDTTSSTKTSEIELLGEENKRLVIDLQDHVNRLEVCDRDDHRKRLAAGINDVRSCNEILKRSLRRSQNVHLSKQDSST